MPSLRKRRHINKLTRRSFLLGTSSILAMGQAPLINSAGVPVLAHGAPYTAHPSVPSGTITVSNPGSPQTVGTAFTVSGTLSGYAHAPTLNYGYSLSGPWSPLPSGSTVTTTSFSFSDPATTAPVGTISVYVQDANNPSIVGGSATFTCFSIPTNTQTFAQATAGMAVQESFIFGSAAVAGPSPQIAINNLNQLSTYFNAYADNNGTTMINSQVFGSYQPMTSTANFAMNPDNLALTATLSSGQSIQPIAFCTIANTSQIDVGQSWPVTPDTPITAFNYPSGAPAPQVGQLIAIQYAGMYFIATMSGSGSSLLLGLYPCMTASSSTQIPIPSYSGCAAFLPICLVYVTAINGLQVTLDAPLPTFVKVGCYYGNCYTPPDQVYSDAQSTVTAITGATTNAPVLTVDRLIFGGGFANGWIVLVPPTQSAQLWRRSYNFPGFNGAVKMAMECVMNVPPSQGLARGFSPSTIPSGARCGVWPAWWMYSGTSLGVSFDYSELDIMELFYSNTEDATQYTGNNLGPYPDNNGGAPALVNYIDTADCGSGSSYYNCNLSYDLSSEQITIGFIATTTGTWRYINGTLWRADKYEWTSAEPPQYGWDLAMGSILGWAAGNLQLPLFDSEFPIPLKIYSITQYLQ